MTIPPQFRTSFKFSPAATLNSPEEIANHILSLLEKDKVVSMTVLSQRYVKRAQILGTELSIIVGELQTAGKLATFYTNKRRKTFLVEAETWNQLTARMTATGDEGYISRMVEQLAELGGY